MILPDQVCLMLAKSCYHEEASVVYLLVSGIVRMKMG